MSRFWTKLASGLVAIAFITGIAVSSDAVMPVRNKSIISVNPTALNNDIEAFVIKEKLKTSQNKAHEKWFVENLKPAMGEITLKGAKLSTVFQLSNPNPNAMRNIVNVTLKSDREIRKLAFPVTMKLEKPFWVVKNFISAKASLRSKGLVLEKRTVSDDPSFYLGEETDPSQWMARINLIPGNILDRRQIETKPVVYQNDQVHVLIHMAGGINITVQATALESGGIGDRIRIKRWGNERQANYYVGTITGYNTVEMDM